MLVLLSLKIGGRFWLLCLLNIRACVLFVEILRFKEAHIFVKLFKRKLVLCSSLFLDWSPVIIKKSSANAQTLKVNLSKVFRILSAISSQRKGPRHDP